MAKRDDPTIELLYGIAKRVFEGEAAYETAQQGTINIICSKAASQFNLELVSGYIERIPLLKMSSQESTVPASATSCRGRTFPTSSLPFDGLRTYEKSICDTFQAAALARGLLSFDQECDKSLKSVPAAYYRAINKKR
ncbi:hypothetical protein BC941DRAFT_518499 [Chlamydoabsidia padenii]|nr:hypothetical protein BC941DRAFT_518499 [Chlamydoabsidia padenii]